MLLDTIKVSRVEIYVIVRAETYAAYVDPESGFKVDTSDGVSILELRWRQV